ncbi:hypothetical protein ACO0E1_15540 [Curtobacterium sp. RRHDQ66]|uniref:hypothetical protein n=1 Tax=Curtobacterium guangdongense TaxID=3413380 RepID=UPI003BF2C259
MRMIDGMVIAVAAMLLGAGIALMVWSTSVAEGSALWNRTMSVGSALSIASAMVGAVGTIFIRWNRTRQ